MKKVALLCFAILSVFTAKAQLEWAPVGARYYYGVWWYNPISGQENGTMAVEVAGDTIVQGKACRYFQQITGQVAWSLLCQSYQITYEEDGRVYFFDEEAQSFTLFYDFNKTPGETWEVPFCNEEGLCDDYSMLFQVDSITYTQLNNIPVKTLHLKYTSSWSDEWVSGLIIYEGIGSVPYLHFIRSFCLIDEQDISGLHCYESPATGTINFFGGPPCTLNTSTNESDSDASQLLLYPNPAASELTIRFTAPPTGQAQVRVFDAHGRLVQMIQKDLLDAALSLSVTDYPTGMYVLQVMTEGKTWPSQRFVKQ